MNIKQITLGVLLCFCVTGCDTDYDEKQAFCLVKLLKKESDVSIFVRNHEQEIDDGYLNDEEFENFKKIFFNDDCYQMLMLSKEYSYNMTSGQRDRVHGGFLGIIVTKIDENYFKSKEARDIIKNHWEEMVQKMER